MLERLATIAFHRGRHAEAEQRRAEASMIADYAGDHELAERLRAPVPRIDTRPPRRMILKTPVVGVAARSAPPSVPGRTKRASER